MHPRQNTTFNHNYILGIVLPVAGKPPKWMSLFLCWQEAKLLPHTSSAGFTVSEPSALTDFGLPNLVVPGIDKPVVPFPGPGYWHSAPLYSHPQVFL